MSRTILEIAQEAAERDASAPAPTKLFETNDRIARILRQAAKDSLREYLRSAHWQGLSELQSEWVFELVPGRYAYPLPPDFLRTIPRTEQRNGWPLGLVGPASPQVWAGWVHGRAATACTMGWRIKNNSLWIEPTPQAHELVVIEYISRYPAIRLPKPEDFDFAQTPPRVIAPLVPRDGFVQVQDTDRYLNDNPLDGRYGEPEGFDVGQWPQEFHETMKRISQASGTSPAFEVRQADFERDDDRPAFADDYLLSLGMTFRLRRALGKPYAEHAAEYEEEMHIKGATDAGAGAAFSLDRRSFSGQQVPLGNGDWMID